MNNQEVSERNEIYICLNERILDQVSCDVWPGGVVWDGIEDSTSANGALYRAQYSVASNTFPDTVEKLAITWGSIK